MCQLHDYAKGISTFFDSAFGCTKAHDWHVTMTLNFQIN